MVNDEPCQGECCDYNDCGPSAAHALNATASSKYNTHTISLEATESLGSPGCSFVCVRAYGKPGPSVERNSNSSRDETRIFELPPAIFERRYFYRSELS